MSILINNTFKQIYNLSKDKKKNIIYTINFFIEVVVFYFFSSKFDSSSFH